MANEADIILRVRSDTRGASAASDAVRRVRNDVERIRQDTTRPILLTTRFDQAELQRARAALAGLRTAAPPVDVTPKVDTRKIQQAERDIARLAQAQARAVAAAGDYERAATILNNALSRVSRGTETAARIQAQLATVQRQAATAQERAAAAAGRQQREAQRTADAEIRAARATGDHARALNLIEAELSQASTGTARYNNLLAQKAAAEQRAARETERAARAQAQANRQTQTGAPVLPRTFAGITAQGARDLATAGLAFAGVSGAADLATRAVQSFGDAYVFKAELDATTASIRAQTNGIRDFSELQRGAAAFGERYKRTQQETNAALAASVPILRTSSQSTEQVLTQLARLAVVNPQEGIEGAAFALRELTSGDITSFVERFNQSRDSARELRDEIANGADPIIALSRYLDDAGVSMAALDATAQGAAGQLREVARAQEELKLAQAELAAGPGVVITDVQAAATRGLARVLSGDLIPSFEELSAKSQVFDQAYRRAILSGASVVQAQLAGIQAVAQTQGQSAAAFDATIAAARATEQQINAVTEAQQRLNAAGATDASSALTNVTQSSPQAAGALEGLIQQFNTGRISVDQFTIGLEAYRRSLVSTEPAYVAAQRSSTAAIAAIEAENEARRASVVANVTAAAESERLAQRQRELQEAAEAAARGTLSIRQAAENLASQFPITALEAAKLIGLLRELNNVSAQAPSAAPTLRQQENEFRVNPFAAGRDARVLADQEARLAQARANLQRTRAAEASRASGGRSAASAELQDTESLLTRRDQLNQRLATLTAGTQQYRSVLQQIADINERIASQQERQVRAALDLRIAAIEERRTRREEDQRIAQAQRILASSGASGEQRQAAQDVLDLIPLERERRELDLQQTAREAGQATVTIEQGAVQVMIDGRVVEGRIIANFAGAVQTARGQGGL